jgi:hypothetical protein
MGFEVELQQSLYGAMLEDAQIAGTGAQIYDEPPQRADGGSLAAFPHIAIGAVVIAEWDTITTLGFDFLLRLHTRSRSAGMMETKTIQGVLYERLHRGSLELPNFRVTDIQRQVSDVTRVSDGSFHGICEYRGMAEKIAE